MIKKEQAKIIVRDNVTVSKGAIIEKKTHCLIHQCRKFKRLYSTVKKFLFSTTLQHSEYFEQNYRDIRKQIKQPIIFGVAMVVIVVTFFIIWAGLAPIDSAIHAEGYFSLSGHRKMIQHHEGGIVKKILVKDGDFVKRGEPLIILNDAKARVEMTRFLWHLRDNYLMHERLKKKLHLLAHFRNDQNSRYLEVTMVKPKNAYMDYSNQKVVDLYIQQVSLFSSYKGLLKNNIDTLYSRIEQKKAEIASLNEKITYNLENIKTHAAEYKRIRALFDKGLYTEDKISEMKLKLQSYEGEIKENRARLAQSSHLLSEAKTNVFAFLDRENMDSYEEFKKNLTDLHMTELQYLSALDTFERTIIRSPNDGEVTDLQVHTIVASLQPNVKLLEIIPQDDVLVIQAEVLSKDIDSILIGSKVKIQLGAYRSRIVPRINGEVIYISADKFDKQQISGLRSMSASSFYKVKIKIQQNELDKINHNIDLKTGMPVHIFIVKGTRTFAQYLYSPIIDSFHRAFIEE